MNAIEWVSLVGSIASIIGLLLYLLDKKNIISTKFPLKLLVLLVGSTVILIVISFWKNQTEVNIKQGTDNNNNKFNIEVTD